MALRLKRFVFLTICLPFFAFAQNTRYVLDNRDNLLVPKTTAFIEQLSSELFSKTSFSLFVAAVDQTPSQSNHSSLESPRESYKKALTQHIPKPYTVIVFMKNDKKIDIISSNPDTFLNEFKVFIEYMVPLLPKQADEILSPERISAIVLNGYVEAGDMVASHFGVNLEHNFRVDESGGREFVRIVMYVMLLTMFGTIGLIYFRRKK